MTQSLHKENDMKIKTSELKAEDGTLDWAVAKCLNVDEYILNESFMTRWTDDDDECENYHYSSDWAQGGPIIEREDIDTVKVGVKQWRGRIEGGNPVSGYGPTPLIAAMRCYVASKLGDTVDIPEELI